MRITYVWLILSKDEEGGIYFVLFLEALVLTTVDGKGEFGVAFKEINTNFYCCFNLLTS